MMDLQELSKLTSIRYLQESFSGKNEARSCEIAIRDTDPHCTTAIETAVRNATLIFELLVCRIAHHDLYKEFQGMVRCTSEEKIRINSALSHLREQSMLPDLLEQMSIWLRELSAVMALGLKRKTRLSPGDVLLVPLFNGSYAYAQIVPPGRVNILDVITTSPALIGDLDCCETRFGPLMVGYKFHAKHGVWFHIGTMGLKKGFSPGFVERNYHRDKNGQMCYGPWYEVKGDRDVLIGDSLPIRYRDFEIEQVWSVYSLEQRIITGRLGPPTDLAFITESWFQE